MKIKYLIPTFVIFLSTNLGAQSNQIELECTGNENVAIVESWMVIDNKNQVNAGKKSYYVTIKNESMTINDVTLKKIPQKFSREHGFSEYGDFESKDSEIVGHYFYEREGSGKSFYSLKHLDLRLYRLSGEFQFSETFYIKNISNSWYKKYNKSNFANAYVNLSVEGNCKKVVNKQKF